MKKNTILYSLLVILFAFANRGWAQSDTAVVVEENGTAKVNIAYGIQEAEKISSAISTVLGQDLLKSSVANFGSTLYGKFPGVFISQGGGEPGYDSPVIRIRGANAAPLVIIDGFERDMTYITPEEIETVSVLKDASALALYGMKGANGAIVITTRRGSQKKGDITFTVQSGLQSPVNTVDVLDARNYMTLHNQASVNDDIQPRYSVEDIASAGTSPRFPDVNWKQEVLRNFSNISRAVLGADGGSEFISYYLNVGFLYNDGIYKPENPDMMSNANLTRLNVRSNVDLKITNSTLFSMDLAGSMNRSAYPAYSASEIWNAIFTLPPNSFNVKNPDGSFGGTSLLMNNPVAMLETSGRNNSIDHFLNAGFRLKQDFDFIAEGLSGNLNYVIDNGANNSDGNWRYFQVRQIAPGVGDLYEYYSFRVPTQYNTWSSARSTRSSLFSADITYNLPATGKSELDVIIRYQGDNQYLSSNDLVPYLVNNYGARVQYAFDKRYMVELAASYYGSDHFAEGNRYGLFPSGSVAWVLSNEGFLSGNTALTFAKIRASYGMNGYNRYVSGRYPFMQYYVGGGGFPLGTGWDWYSGLQAGMLANPDYTWELSNKLNAGLEAELFSNAHISLDYYLDKRSNILYIDYTQPSVAGATLPYENIGKLTNSGIDLRLMYTYESATVNWFTELVGSYFQNTIDEMGEALYTGELSHLNRTGHSVSSIFGYEVIGTFETQDEINDSPVQTFGTPRVGDFKYADQNSDQVIDSRDMKVIADNNANIDLGLRLGFSFRGFDLEALLHGKLNRDIVLDWNKLSQPFVSGNAITEIAQEEGFPPLTLSNLNNYQVSTYWVRNGDFLKIRNLELGYTLPANLASKIRLNSTRFFVRGVNLLSLSQWKYSDPEFTVIGYPPQRTYMCGLNINF
jgi:TonB-linked SusC/RagA family outer membrane protein